MFRPTECQLKKRLGHSKLERRWRQSNTDQHTGLQERQRQTNKREQRTPPGAHQNQRRLRARDKGPEKQAAQSGSREFGPPLS